MNSDKHPSRKTPATGAKKSVRTRLTSAVQEGRRFIHDEVWELDVRPLSRVKTALISFLRIVTIMVRGFIHDKCYMQAGTLTYLTLMSLVPILALMFSVSKGLGAQEVLMENIGLRRNPALEEENRISPEEENEQRDEDELDALLHGVSDEETGEPLRDFVIVEGSRLDEMPEQFGQIAITVFSAVERTNVRTLGVIGLVFLFWTVIRVMSKVENSFNIIWGVRRPRALTRRFSDYLSILVVVPILVLLATSINAFLSSERALLMVRERVGEFSFIYEFAIRWSMLAAIVLAFMFLLMFMPNTKVRFLPALIGGFFTGVAWFAAQELYFLAQGGVTQYNAVYGTFAVLPFFLVWLHTSWLIVLFGAEMAFAVQNYRTFRVDQSGEPASFATLSLLGMMIMLSAGEKYLNDGRPWSSARFGEKYGIPTRLISNVVYTLTQEGLLRQLAEEPDMYVPGRDLEHISLADVELAFRGKTDQRIISLLKEAAPFIMQAEAEYLQAQRASLGSRNLRSLAEEWAAKETSSAVDDESE